MELTSHSTQVVLEVQNLPANAGDLNPGLGRSLGGGNGTPLQYSCLENPTDRGSWRATIHGVAESDMTEHHIQHSTWYCVCCVLSRFSCVRLSDPSGSSVHGVFPERILEWVGISFSRGSS